MSRFVLLLRRILSAMRAGGAHAARPLAVIAVVVAGLVVFAGITRAEAPCGEPASCRAVIPYGPQWLTLFASAPLDKPQPALRRAVFVIHGTDGNAGSYFRVMVRAAALAGQATETLVLAPRFLEDGDSDKPAPGELSWRRGDDWRAGDPSRPAASGTADGGERFSSFAILDDLLARLADRHIFPALSSVVLAGHSAGGQFVQRYAIAGGENVALPPLRYIVANPSSYLYLDARRPDAARPGSFAVPTNTACDANRFKYGFAGMNAYFAAQAVDDMTARYRARPVIYLLGTADNDPRAKNLSRTCAAMAQGASRFVRGTNFVAYMDALHQPHAHRLVTVPGVAHSARRMFQSAEGLAALFAD